MRIELRDQASAAQSQETAASHSEMERARAVALLLEHLKHTVAGSGRGDRNWRSFIHEEHAE
jgi:hypothetical protein